MVAYQEPVIQVVAAERISDAISVRVLFISGKIPTDPLAPASLLSQDDPKEVVLTVHKLVSRDDENVYEFESYDASTVLLSPGNRLIFRSWWTQQDLELVTDTSLEWRLDVYQRSGDHEHCALTWETIDPGDAGYQSSKGTWISVQTYEKYIRDDLLGCVCKASAKLVV